MDLCRVTTKARWSKDQRAFSFLIVIPVCQGSAAPTPFGATLSDSVGGSLLEFHQLRSCDRSVFCQFQLSYPAESRWVPAPRCEVALNLGTPASTEEVCLLTFRSTDLWTWKAAFRAYCSFRWKLRLNGTALRKSGRRRRLVSVIRPRIPLTH